ncbi:MAG: ATP-binding protein [Bacteroidia bacterium]|nr:ATP-binding protein [Bacteroidia bacterium]
MPKGNKSFYEYLNNGGFPEFLEFKNRRILQELFNDVINRDIIVRYGIRNPMTIKNLALFLLSNAAKEISYHNLTDSFNFRTPDLSQNKTATKLRKSMIYI